MAYIVRKTTGEVLKVVEDSTIDQSTSVYLVGKSYVGYGEYISNNFIRLLENSSSATAPQNPLEGQLWYDASEKVLKNWTMDSGTGSWVRVTGSTGYTGSAGSFGGTTASNINISNVDATIDATTGALVVAGGVGVGGDLYLAGNITGQKSLSVTGGDVFAKNASLSGNIDVQESLTVAGTASFASTAAFGATVESVSTITGATGEVVHDLYLGSTFFHKSPADNFKLAIANVPTDLNKAIVVCLCIEQGSVAYLPSEVKVNGETQSVKWAAAAAPTGNAFMIDVISFSILKIDSTWRVLGQSSYFG